MIAGPLAPFDNIILRLGTAPGPPEAPQLYAKVGQRQADQGYLLHFTSVSPAMQVELDRLLGKNQPDWLSTAWVDAFPEAGGPEGWGPWGRQG